MKKSICLITMDITLKGGIERVVCNMANNLCYDFNVDIISFFNSNKIIIYPLDSNVKVKFLQKDRIFKYSTYKFWLLFSILKNRFFLSKLDYDKIVVMYPLISILFVIFFPKHNKKIIVSEHSEYFSQGLILRYFRTKTYAKVDKIVTLTNSGKHNFANVGLIANVLPNAVTNFPTQKQWSPKKLVDKSIHCLFAGRFEPVKQVSHVLQIALQSKHINNIRYDFLGDGPDFYNMVQYAKSNNLTNVLFHGSVSNIYDFYDKNHILLIPSITEAFPMVVIEAMSFGCVVICYDSQIGTCEIITNGKDGFIVPRGNIHELYEKINFLSNNMVIFESMSREAIDTASKFKNNLIMKMWRSLILE